MAIIAITRLRLRDPALLDEFFTAAADLLLQAQGADGSIRADAIADANDVWWTVSAWRTRGDMRRYTATEPHRSAMPRLDDWCDEATFADWEQEDNDLPDWETSHEFLIEHGTSAPLSHPSPANATRDFPAPVPPT
jgi:hypothetical protein